MPTRIAIRLSLNLPAVAECGRPSEGQKTNNACTAIAERGSARVQGRGGRHDIIDDDDVGATEHVSSGTGRAKRARNVAETVPWCQPRLRLGVSHARE